MTMPHHLLRSALMLTLAGALTAPLSSCSHEERKEASHEVSADADRAYTDLKTVVTRAEADVQSVDFSDTDFSRDLDRVKSDYDAKVAVVDRDIDRYSAEQKAEIELLKTRYTTAVEQRRAAYQSRTTADTSAPAGTPAPGGAFYKPVGTYDNVTAATLRATYEGFNRMVKQNENRYDIEDWRAVNADWRALNARKELVEDQLSAEDKRAIAAEKVKYAAYKSFDKAEARVAEGAHAVGEAASKVGAAAKGAYKGARDAVRKEDK